MSSVNETDFGERVSIIRTNILSSLNELQTIIDKSLPHAYAYSHVESERLRHQTRANIEAVRAVEAEDRLAATLELVEKLQAVADIAKVILFNGDLQCHTPQSDRQMREDALRVALACLPITKDQEADK
jgi:hypothetical protein